jgi:hypothetical protein
MEKIALLNCTKRGRTRKVRLMERDQYEKLKSLILDQLKKHEEISLMAMLEQPIPLTAKEIGSNEILSMLILVKNDLVARGILRITFSPDRLQIIKLKRRKVGNV